MFEFRVLTVLKTPLGKDDHWEIEPPPYLWRNLVAMFWEYFGVENVALLCFHGIFSKDGKIDPIQAEVPGFYNEVLYGIQIDMTFFDFWDPQRVANIKL